MPAFESGASAACCTMDRKYVHARVQDPDRQIYAPRIGAKRCAGDPSRRLGPARRSTGRRQPPQAVAWPPRSAFELPAPPAAVIHQRLGLGIAAVQAQRLQGCIPAAGRLDAEQRTRTRRDLPHSFGRPPPLVHCPTPRNPEAHADQQRMAQRPWEISTYNGRNPERREERCIAQSPLSPLSHIASSRAA